MAALSSALLEYLQKPKYRKVLTCAPDVEQGLRESFKKSGENASYALFGAPIYGIDIIVAEDSAPGTWRLVQHDHCEVVDDWKYIGDAENGMQLFVAEAGKTNPYVSHANCTILATSEGDSDDRT